MIFVNGLLNYLRLNQRKGKKLNQKKNKKVKEHGYHKETKTILVALREEIHHPFNHAFFLLGHSVEKGFLFVP